MPEIGIAGLIVILIVALLVFGPKRLPEIGRSLGRGMREFKDSISGNDEKPELPARSADESSTPPSTPPSSSA
jgi:sec-independent protein translocase protein TatA